MCAVVVQRWRGRIGAEIDAERYAATERLLSGY